MIRDGSVTFEAYPGYNVIEVNPLVKTAVYTPVPCNAFTVQLDIQETTSRSTTLSVTSTSSTLVPTGLPNIIMLATVVAVGLLIAGAIIMRQRRVFGRREEP
jgi:predicted S18 family serine protease